MQISLLHCACDGFAAHLSSVVQVCYVQCVKVSYSLVVSNLFQCCREKEDIRGSRFTRKSSGEGICWRGSGVSSCGFTT